MDAHDKDLDLMDILRLMATDGHPVDVLLRVLLHPDGPYAVKPEDIDWGAFAAFRRWCDEEVQEP